MLAGWDSACDRRGKELLYRCMEELGATKASLYLADETGTFQLASSYGFGRRDLLAAEVGSGHPKWNWIRRHRTAPAYLNEPHDDAALMQELGGAGTARMLTIPLSVGERLVGFVDARDKARRTPYAAEDVAAARRIGAALEGFLEEQGLFGPPASPEQSAEGPAVTAAPAAAPPTLTRHTLEGLSSLVRGYARLPEVAALALTITDGAAVRALVLQGLPLEQQEREALASHQLARLAELGLRLPPPSRWVWSEEAGGGEEKRREEIHTALLYSGPPAWVVLSVVTPARSAVADVILAACTRHLGLGIALASFRRAARNALRTLLEPGEQSYPHLRQHAQSVSELAQRMSVALKLGDDEEELVTIGAYLHDVGMRELEYARIYRMERPGESERRLYQRHPVVGARILEATSFPGDLAAVVRHHHERWDGAGYPQRLAGRAIPLASRLIHIAEVYDVLTSTSSYKRPVTRGAALDIIRGEAGKQFDPDLVPVLEEVVRA